MSFLKALAAASIVSLAIAGSVFIVQKSNLSVTNPKPANNTAGNNPVEPMALVEKLSEKPAPVAPTSPSKNSDNLTDTLISSIGKHLVENNPSGPQVIDGQQWLTIPSAEELSAELFSKEKKQFDINNLKPKILDSKLIVSPDNSKKAFLAYAKAFDAIIEKYGYEMPKNLNMLAPENLPEIIKVYQNAINAFYKLPVPQLMLAVHKTEIQSLTTQLNLLRIIKNYKTDLVTALLANESLLEVKNEFNQQLAIQ